jgi:hypothetical protein
MEKEGWATAMVVRRAFAVVGHTLRRRTNMSVIEDNPGVRPRPTQAQRDQRTQRKRKRREEVQRAAAAANTQGFQKVLRFGPWCETVGISVAQGRRLVATGKVRVVRLSARAIGVTEAEHQRYLAACASEQSS